MHTRLELGPPLPMHRPRAPLPRRPHSHSHAHSHEAWLALEVAAALVIGAAVVHRVATHDTTTAPATPVTTQPAIETVAPAAAVDAAVPALTVVPDPAGAHVVAHLHVPTGASAVLSLVDAAGTTSATATVGDGPVRLVAPVAGAFVLALHVEGPVEVVGDAHVSSATALRTVSFTLTAGGDVEARIDG